jgi:hypothetical protein
MEAEKERVLNTGFYSIFKEKLERMKVDIKKEMERAKSERRRDWLKQMVQQTKSLRTTIRELEQQMGKKDTCPHCGKSTHEA